MTALQLWDEPRKRVAAIQTELNNRLATIRSSDTLSPAGRRVELARATQHARRQIDALRKEHTAARDARRQQLETHLFGISATTSVADARDAYDRADRIDTPEDAAAAISRATALGDSGLARAIAHRAYQKRWTTVLDNYIDAAPPGTQRDLLEELRAIPTGTGVSTVDSAIFRVRKPDELAGLSDADLEALAGSSPKEREPVTRWPGLSSGERGEHHPSRVAF